MLPCYLDDPGVAVPLGVLRPGASAAYDAGKATFDWLRKRVGEAFNGKQPVTPEQVERQAEDSREIARKLTDAQVTGAADHAETLLAAELEQLGLPAPRARALAAHVRAQALLLATEEPAT
jgi:hypothetical protein